jgi:hypothetical protein
MRFGIITHRYHPFRKVVFHPSNAGLLRTCRQTRHETVSCPASTLEVLDNFFILDTVFDTLTALQAEALSTVVLGEEVVHCLVNYWGRLAKATMPLTRLQRVVCLLSVMPSEKEMASERSRLRMALGKGILRIYFAVHSETTKHGVQRVSDGD